ncbi:MAG: YceI family protein [Planctomycetota bacterium]|nr:YceI family protein [Planctomycetota bacterium]
MKLRSLFLLSLVPALALLLAAARPEDKQAVDPNGAYKVDVVHSSILFKCKHADTSWAFGRFDDFGGTLTFDSAKPENSKIEITIQAKSVNTNSKDRDQHLQSPDFFDVKQFPTATFKSKSVAKKGDKMFAVTGDLMFHGVTKSVSIDMEHTGSNEHPMMGKIIGFYGTLTLKRSDYGISYGQDVLGDEVTLMLSIESAVK